MLLQLAGAGVTFEKHNNPEFYMAIKKINTVRHTLVFRGGGGVVVVKLDSPEDFWRRHDMPEFKDIYMWAIL